MALDGVLGPMPSEPVAPSSGRPLTQRGVERQGLSQILTVTSGKWPTIPDGPATRTVLSKSDIHARGRSQAVKGANLVL